MKHLSLHLLFEKDEMSSFTFTLDWIDNFAKPIYPKTSFVC